uniref:Dickkopf_N domain-containing protein n=1 Tax=Globodera pallida TaxID=36090 RepID=A0A183BKS6_GLOPA
MAKFAAGITFCAIFALFVLDFTGAWKREFLRSPKSNEIGPVDESRENAKDFKSQSDLIAAMMPKRKSQHCYYGVDMVSNSNQTDGAFEEVRCDDDDYDRCLVGKCQNFIEVRKFCATKDGCAAFGCAIEEELECKTCFGDLCNV